MTILVVDDAAMVRRDVGSALKKAGYNVVEAADGNTALEMVRTNALIDCVFCDVNMPWMSGVEFVEEVAKLDPRPAVIMLTTESKPDLVRRAKAAGAIGWIAKPCNPEHLVATASKLALRK